MKFVLLRIAARNVRRNKRRSAVAISALVFGVFMLIVLKGLTDGFTTMATLAAVETRTAALQVHQKGYFENLAGNPAEFSFTPPDGLLESLSALPEVRQASMRLQFLAQITNGINQTLVMATGYDFEREAKVCLRSGTTLVNGSKALTNDDSNSIALGQTLANSFEAATGAEQNTVHTAPPSLLQNTMILSAVNPKGRHNSLDFKVQAVFKSFNAYEEKRQVSLTLQSAQELLGLQGQVTEIAVALWHIKDLSKAVTQVQQLVGPDYEVHTWEELQPFLRDILFRQQVGIQILSVALLVMVLFLITNTMLMAVYERTREMGTMVSLGIKRHQIIQIFLLESALIGVVAASLGCLLGATLVYALGLHGFEFGTLAFEAQRLYPEISLSTLCVTWGVAVLCAAVAGTYPAYRASLLNPVEALRST